MGLKNSKVGWFAFLGGVTGYTTGMLLIWFTNAFDYPLVVGGKPMFSPFSAFPPSYELTILFGAFGAVFGMLFLTACPGCTTRSSMPGASPWRRMTSIFS